jgi:hypothetical protein
MPWRHGGRRPAIYDFADGSLGKSWMPTFVGMTSGRGRWINFKGAWYKTRQPGDFGFR